MIWVPLLAVLCLAAGAALTKDDVIRMARDGKSQQAILDAIHESHATFGLTADDIADLRAGGVGEAIIDAMIETGPAQPPADQQPQAEESQAAPEESPGDVEPQPEEPYYEPVPAPVPVAYPVYPIYYPAYYPVYDPFFPFFGGFFFSFEFIHVSRCFRVFSCDRAVVVVNNRTLSPRGTLVTSRGSVFTTPRLAARGGALQTSRPARMPLDRTGRPGVMGGSRDHLAAGSAMRPRGPVSPRLQGNPRFQGAPRFQGSPRFQGARPAAPARPVQPPRYQSPRYQSPRYAAPRYQSPHYAAPRFQAPGGGGFHGFGSPRAMGGGGHGHGGHH